MTAVDEYRRRFRDDKQAVSVYLDTDVVARLDQQADERTVSRRKLIVTAIEHYLRELEA